MAPSRTLKRRASALLSAALLLGPAIAVADEASPADEAAPADKAKARVVLARFTTSYAHDAEHKARAANVELAAEAINGKALAAGATFSFNDAVGERTAAFGYAKSIVLRDGMIAEGTGGGACQVASTLHAAALLSGLDVLVRAPHSRPSAYIRMGLDATVAIGPGSSSIDLKLKNATPEPVVIHARAARGALEVWIDSAAVGVSEVSLTSEIVERLPFPRVVERDKKASDDVVRVKAFGIPGFRVKRTREIRAADGTVRRDVRIDVYPPTSEIVRVAPSLDESRIDLRADRPKAAPGSSTPEPAPFVVEAGVARPALVQLRPSTLVVLDNSAR